MILKNARRERLAQNLAKGMSEVDAHEAAGYKRNYQAASNICRKVEVQDRVREIQARAAASVELSAVWVLEKLVAVHNAAMQGNPVLDRYGKPTGEYIQNFAGANRALELIGKSDGISMFTEKSETTHKGDPISALLESIEGRSRAVPTSARSETKH